MKNTRIAVDINLLNAKTKICLKDIANQSIHGTTKPSPYVLFNEERAALSVYADKHLEPNITAEKSNTLYRDKELHRELNHTIQHDIHVFDILLHTKTSGA